MGDIPSRSALAWAPQGLHSFRINLVHYVSSSIGPSSLKKYSSAPAWGPPLVWERSSCSGVVSYKSYREIFAVTPGAPHHPPTPLTEKMPSVCTAVSHLFPSFSAHVRFSPFQKYIFPEVPPLWLRGSAVPCGELPLPPTPNTNAASECQIFCILGSFLLAGSSNFYMATDLIQ